MTTEKRYHIGTNVSKELIERVREVANEQERSVGSLVRIALRREVYRHATSEEEAMISQLNPTKEGTQ